MTKSELKSGMVVQLRDKQNYLLAGDYLLRKGGWVSLDVIDDFSIVKVFNQLIDLDDLKTTTDLLWERKEPYKFTDRQLEVLAPYRHDYLDWWFAKDEYGDLYVYSEKPKKQKSIWLDTSGVLENIMFEKLFSDYDWETEPIQLKEIFKVKKDE